MSFDAITALLRSRGDLDFYEDTAFVDKHITRSVTILNPDGEDLEIIEKRFPRGGWEISFNGDAGVLSCDDLDSYAPVGAYASQMADYFMGVTTYFYGSNSQRPTNTSYLNLPHYASVYKGAFDQRCSDIRVALIQEQIPDWFPTSLIMGPETVWVKEPPEKWRVDNPHRRQTLYETFQDVVIGKYHEIFPWDVGP